MKVVVLKPTGGLFLIERHPEMGRMRNPRAQQLKAGRRALVQKLKSERGCVDCGENDFRYLDFDHRNQKEKYKEVSVLISEGRAWLTILKEIIKCDVRCANCHRKSTVGDWYNWEHRAFARLSCRFDPCIVHQIS